ncbi:MAG TPA: hypothetical protein PLU53_04775 [Bacteroidia bacterium]|nr:hypothetical protein [Bacteroidia bacterium]
MKQYFYINFISLILFSNLISGQDRVSRKELMNRLDVFLNDFSGTSSFREIGGTEFSENQASKFKEMFAENAIIFDDINASVVEDNLGGSPYQLKNKPLDEYIADVRKGFPSGIRVDVLNSAIDFSRLDSNLINIVISKKVSGKSSTLNRFENNDTLLLEMLITPDDRLLIKKISMLGSNFSCANDKDNDGVIDEQDGCPGVKGEIRYKGCPDRDRDGIPDNTDQCPEEYGTFFNKGCPQEVFTNKYGIDLFAGFVMNSPENILFDKAALSYDEIDLERTNEGTVAYAKKSVSSILNGLELSISLNKNNTTALGIGINYNKFTTDITWNDFHTEYKEIDNGILHFPFRRLLSLKQTRESLETQYLSIPLLLKFRLRLEEKIGIYYELGPAFDLISVKSSPAAVADEEAIYIYNTQSAGIGWTYSKNYTPSPTDWVITREMVNSYSDHGAEAYFADLRTNGYEVALDKPLSAPSEKSKRTGFSGIARVGAFYMIDRSISIFAGAVYAYHFSLKKQEGSYQPVDDSGNYHSMVNGVKKYNGQSYGLMLGLKYGFGK